MQQAGYLSLLSKTYPDEINLDWLMLEFLETTEDTSADQNLAKLLKTSTVNNLRCP